MTTTYTLTFEPYEFDLRPNRYPGHCSCGTYVYAGDGFYNGQVYCSQPGSVWDLAWVCESSAPREIARIEAQRAAARENMTPRERTAEEIARDEARRVKMAEQDAAWARRGLTRCGRCGGAGGSSHWPGFTCYECGGSGAVMGDD